MKTRIWTGVVAAALVSLAAGGRAEACGQGSDGPWFGLAIITVVTAPVIDLSFAIHDLGVDRSSKGSAVAEILLTAPQLVLGSILTVSARNNPDYFFTCLALTAIPAALAGHGIYVLTRDDDDRKEQRLTQRRRSWALAPTAIADGTTILPGVMGVGRF